MCSTLNGALRPGSRRFNTEPRGRRFCVSYPSRRPCAFPRDGRSTEGYAYSGIPAAEHILLREQPSVSLDAGRFMSTASALETPAHPPHTDRNLGKVGGSHNRPSALPGIRTEFTNYVRGVMHACRSLTVDRRHAATNYSLRMRGTNRSVRAAQASYWSPNCYSINVSSPGTLEIISAMYPASHPISQFAETRNNEIKMMWMEVYMGLRT